MRHALVTLLTLASLSCAPASNSSSSSSTGSSSSGAGVSSSAATGSSGSSVSMLPSSGSSHGPSSASAVGSSSSAGTSVSGGSTSSSSSSSGGAAGTVLYDGESHPYFQGGMWDSNGSTIDDATVAPHSGTHHIRTVLHVRNWWAGTLYTFGSTPVDLSGNAALRLFAKADAATTVNVFLVDNLTTQSGNFASLPLTTAYTRQDISASFFSNVDLAHITGIIFSASEAGPADYTLDVDDISLQATVAPTGTVVDADDPAIQRVGRWDNADAKNPASDWNSAYVRVNFQGPDIAVRLVDGNNNWTFSVDDGAMQTLATTATEVQPLASGLTDTTHSLLLARRTESYFGRVTFRGFVLAQGKTLAARPADEGRRMEIIGDSISAGYADEGSDQSRATQNGYQAYGPQTARLLQAQWHVEAVSGIGVYRNLGDSIPPSQAAMPALFEQTFRGASTPAWDFSSWTPDVVVVALGTNDSISDGSNTVGSNTFRLAYSAFVQSLRAHHPNAHIFCLSPFASDAAAFRADVQAVVTSLADARVHHLDPVGDIPGTDNVTTRPWLDGANGSDYVGDWTHPTVAGHTKIAAKLSVEIAAKLAW